MEVIRTELEKGEKVIFQCEECCWVYVAQNRGIDWVGDEHVTKCPECGQINMTDIESSVYLFDRLTRNNKQ
jgi:rubrerythrin